MATDPFQRRAASPSAPVPDLGTGTAANAATGIADGLHGRCTAQMIPEPSAKSRVSRQDWLDAALRRFIRDGVDSVKVLSLSDELGVSRSSFYWHFKSRPDLLEALLDAWKAKNTAGLIAQAEAPAATITEAVCSIFRCVFDTRLFDTALDFAVRDWARRAPEVRAALAASDAQRLAALSAMYARHGYGADEAETRARV
ncbi:MAG: TetR/AcrR family transcriptional regulator, partial [Pseudomonadota bacterium]